MPFVVKATYRNETRKFLFNNSHFPSYEELYHQLYRVFAIGHAYYLSKLLFSPQEGARILIGMEAHSAMEYDIHCAPFKGHIYSSGCLMFSVFDETPHKKPATGTSSFIHPIPPAAPTPFFAPPPPPPPQQPQEFVPHVPFLRVNSEKRNFPINPGVTQPQPMDIDSRPSSRQGISAMDTECCSVAQGKKEVRSLMDDFLRDFTRILGNTFGEDHSFPDQLDTPTISRMKTSRGLSPLPALDLDGSLHIPGSFIQPRPQSPNAVESDVDADKGHTSPQLEHLQELHPGIWCDFCGKQIRGLRFRCQECAYYDLCANCIVVNQALDKHNANHTMIHRFNTISPPSMNPSSRKDTTPKEFIKDPGPQVCHPASSFSGASGKDVHSGIRCDVCDNVVVGRRHKCLNCPDYDLCDNCIKAASMEHPLHRFMTLETPSRIYFQSRPISPVRDPISTTHLETLNHIHFQTPSVPLVRDLTPMAHSALCNLCDSRIRGDRYKCMDCPDFDTCASCFAITMEHHPFHAFVKVSRPADFMVRPKPEPIHHFATCDVCHKNILGVRYKCMHPDCPDFDLCQDCEALPIAVHPSTHSFLKIKRGDIGIPSVKRNLPRGVATVPIGETPQLVAIPVPSIVSETVVDRGSPPVSPVLASPPSPIERLHAIRAQAERRLSARMQQLQSYPFSDGSASPAVDPIIEERLVRERKEAEEKASMMDKEIEELEKARRRKHHDALRQPPRPYHESLKAAFADAPEVYRKILKLLIDCFGTTDSAVITSTTQQIRQLLDGHPDLLDGLDSFVAKEVSTATPTEPALESEPSVKEEPAREDIVDSTTPEMVQKKTSYFGNPFIHSLESPLQAIFISDNNISDGHIFPPGAEFVKSWYVKNNGTEPWAEGTKLVFVGGMRLGASANAPSAYGVGIVNSGEETDVCAGDMKAPEVPGRYISHWRLRDPGGRYFGPRMWCDIEVLEVEPDNSCHGSLVSSAVVMPETAPEHAARMGDTVNLLSILSSPVTVPSSIVARTDDASSDTSSVGSVSLVNQSDSDWDEIQAGSPRRSSLPPRETGEEVEYHVLYDSASDDA